MYLSDHRFTQTQSHSVLFSRIGRDWQFDEAVSKIYGCRVLAYDPRLV